jgi:hypothetical protein
VVAPSRRCLGCGLGVLNCCSVSRVWSGEFASLSPGQRADRRATTHLLNRQREIGTIVGWPRVLALDVYPTRAAAETAKGPRGTVIESLGKVWLFTIAETNWQPVAGVRIARIGPLPVTPNVEYTAVYLEGIFDPGERAPIHMHSGPEAFYALTGDTCLETPDGVLTGREIVVQGGPPMLLVATGTARRRGVTLILHDSSQPATTMVHDWTPKGLCK